MSIIYRLHYFIGYTPWEQIDENPAGDQVERLFAREENGQTAPYGRVLEIGCGSGIWSVKLAERGWDVTGIDNVPKAIRRAEQRAREAGVAPRFVLGDATALDATDHSEPYDLFLDVGCFHELDEDQAARLGSGITGVAKPDASLLLMAWNRASRSPMYPHGVRREEVQAAFPEWQIVDEEAMDVTSAPDAVQKAAPLWYRLRRR